MFGPAFYVCPVTEPFSYGPDSTPFDKEPKREVYLPEGTAWYDYETHQYYRGGQTMIVDAPIDKMPVFVKAGCDYTQRYDGCRWPGSAYYALFIGLAVVNLTKPGIGVTLDATNTDRHPSRSSTRHPQSLRRNDRPRVSVQHHSKRWFAAMFCKSSTFSVLFAIAVSAIGEKGKPIVRAMESLSQVMFKFTNYVMMFAPIGVGAAMAHTIGTQGLGVLKNLGTLVLSLYLALIIFVVVVFGVVILIARVPLRKFVAAVRAPAALAFATTSSESALPKAMESMERFGVPRHIVGFVMPTGYSFNLDGSTLYLALASVFVAQAAEATTGQHMGWDRQILMVLTLMITSKGVAAVPRASLVILLATVNSFLPAGLGPIGVAVIFGVDELMDMGRTCVNLIGNCLATVVVARWEGEFDDKRARVFGTPAETELDLKRGDAAFADAVAKATDRASKPVCSTS